MKTQDCPPHLRAFLALLSPLIPKYDLATVWDDFLTFGIAQFNVTEEYVGQKYHHLEDRFQSTRTRYSSKEWLVFADLWNEYVRVMMRKLLTPADCKKIGDNSWLGAISCASAAYEYPDHSQWYDALGDFYMELTSKYKSSKLGQFFTPMEICHLMSALTGTEHAGEFTVNNRRNINEPACGSGRMVLPIHAANPGISFFSLQDIDPICCRMAVLNCLMHGLPCEVVCCDSLDPEDFRFGYRLNRYLYSHQAPSQALSITPHLWPIEPQECHIWRFWQNRLREIEAGIFDPITYTYKQAA